MSRSFIPNLARVCVLFALAGLAACSAPAPGADFNDPYETTNRRIHDFNKQLDTALLRPAGQRAARNPPEVTEPITNFADNVGLPGMVANGLLQGDIGGASTNTMRFLINSTVGLAGLLDPADAIGLFEQSTDFGETLATWGVPEGAYMELPVLGPSTERDTAGRIVDTILNPFSRYATANQVAAGTLAKIGDRQIQRGRFGETIDSVLYDSADSYAQTRLTYLQNRRFELGENAGDAGGIDPYAIDPYAE